MEYLNDKHGRRLAVGAGTKFIGAGGEGKILDDPHMPGDPPETMEKTCEWYFKSWRTRTNNPLVAFEVVNMQRLGMYDLCEMLKVHEKDLFTWLILPSRFDSKKRYVNNIGWTDPRTEDGELLWPEYLDDEAEKQLRRSLKESADAQMDQDPTANTDVIYKPANLNNFYTEITYDPDGDLIISSTDTALKSKATSDFTACSIGLKKGQRLFLIDGFAEKYEFGDLYKNYCQILSKWVNRKVKFYIHLIEDSTVGPPLANLASKKFNRIKTVQAIRNKLSRFKSVTPFYEANRLWFPAPGAVIVIDGVRYPIDTSWVDEWQKQTRQVPTGSHDDCPDSVAQMIESIEAFDSFGPDEEIEADEEDEEDRFFYLD
jgi:phage terminase large subunit-like protein